MSNRFFRALTDARDCSFDEDVNNVYDQVVSLTRKTSEAFLAIASGDIRSLAERALYFAQREPDPEEALDRVVDEITSESYASEIKTIVRDHIEKMQRLEALYSFYKSTNPDRPLH